MPKKLHNKNVLTAKNSMFLAVNKKDREYSQLIARIYFNTLPCLQYISSQCIVLSVFAATEAITIKLILCQLNFELELNLFEFCLKHGLETRKNNLDRTEKYTVKFRGPCTACFVLTEMKIAKTCTKWILSNFRKNTFLKKYIKQALEILPTCVKIIGL